MSPTPPPAPTSISLVVSSPDSLTVSWTAPILAAVPQHESSSSKTPVYGYIVQYRLNDGKDEVSNQDDDNTQFVTLHENLPAAQTQVRATNLCNEQGSGFFFRVATVMITQESDDAQRQQVSATQEVASAIGKDSLNTTGVNSRSAWATHSNAFYLQEMSPTAAKITVNTNDTAAISRANPPTREYVNTTNLLSAGKAAHAFHLTHDEQYPTMGYSSAMMTAAGRSEFQEVYMRRFTAATSCYSAPRYVSQAINHQGGRSGNHPDIISSSTPWKATLATEQNLLEMTLHSEQADTIDGNIDNKHGVSFAQYPLPTPPGLPRRLAKHFVCVGYSSCRYKSGWEAMVLLDTAHQSHHQQQDLINTGDVGTVGGDHSYAGNNVNSIDDDRTVATVDSASSASHHHTRSSSGSGYRRANSGGNASVSSTDGGGASVASSSMASVSSSAPAVILTGGEGSGGGLTSRSSKGGGIRATLANLDEEEGVEGSLGHSQQPVARLVLIHREKELHYAKPLDFRPLAPCIGSLFHARNGDTTNDDENEAIVGVWIGSADDTKLRFFRANDTIGSLVEVPIDATLNEDNESPMSFESPIMAIDCLSLPSSKVSGTFSSSANSPSANYISKQEQGENEVVYNNLLAVASQDGVIRLIGYSNTSRIRLRCQEEYTVTIDGPIVTVILNFKKGKVEAVVGSLCGYVARFLKDITVNNTSIRDSWEGPYMVAEGFATGAQEDSALVVHSWGDTIAVGTYSGRCLLYEQTCSDDDEDFGQPFLDFQLPESIHGICHIPSEDFNTLLLVTTRKSIHLFQEKPKVYDSDMAKRILKSLVEMRHRSKSILSPKEESKERGDTKKTSDKSPSAVTT